MFFLKLSCKNCPTITDVVSRPEEKLKHIRCSGCGNDALVVEEAQSITASALMAALRDLNDRLMRIEELIDGEPPEN